MKVTFLGASGEVTGSCYLVENSPNRFLVDCGLFQGDYFAEPKNQSAFPFNAKDLKGVFITHAHLDHTGRLPKLVRDGYRGPIFMTTPTYELAELLLEDAYKLMKKEAKRDRRAALYDRVDLNNTLSQIETVHYGDAIRLSSGEEIIFHDAGHILGSSFIEFRAGGKTVVFSGDVGHPPTKIIRWPHKLPRIDALILESTYGGRIHEDFRERRFKLRRIILDVVKNKGVLLIPTFALERTQEIIYELNLMYLEESIPKIPVFVDSPLANKITNVFKKHTELFNTEAMRIAKMDMDLFDFPGLNTTSTYAQSLGIARVPAPKIIIAGSGMMNGGRILDHALKYLGLPTTVILFVGFQAKGSLGRRIFEGMEQISVYGKRIKVKAEVKAIGAFSGHGDRQSLFDWVSRAEVLPTKVFLTHGEIEQAASFATMIAHKLKIKVAIPLEGNTYSI